MVVDDIKYGVSYLPENCIAYRDGYRFGAYYENLKTGESHITDFFKDRKEVQKFVNNNPQYGRG